ncbi:MAG: zinc ribbon domain-containing protein [Methanomassiliicoccaceae archaeon]|nr:zinc ribbon domain-containing protein [Methanomassiliicoccaceae archaeon]
MKECIACGMPMVGAADFAMNDESKDYCVHCARPDGSMQSFEEKKENLTGFIVRTQGLAPRPAEAAALSMMRKLPAWRGDFD